MSLRLDCPIVEALRRLAGRKGIGLPLVRMWLLERLQLEMSRVVEEAGRECSAGCVRAFGARATDCTAAGG